MLFMNYGIAQGCTYRWTEAHRQVENITPAASSGGEGITSKLRQKHNLPTKINQNENHTVTLMQIIKRSNSSNTTAAKLQNRTDYYFTVRTDCK